MKARSVQMTALDLSLVLNISEETVRKLASMGQLPCIWLGNRMYFNFDEVLNHFRQLEGVAA